MARHKYKRLTARTLEEGVDYLCQVDPDMARAVKDCGPPALRRNPPGFATLLRSIVGQQVSVAAARSIWLRLEGALGEVTPQSFLALSDEQIRAVGFSGQKMRYGRMLAADIHEGRLALDGVVAMDDETAIAELVKGMGIGRWTAEIYLIFAHGRPDIMPGNDLGLVVAAHHLKGLRKRPDPKRMLKIAEPWRPWRTVAALMLWHYRHNMPDWSSAADKKKDAKKEAARKPATKARKK